VRQYIDGFRQHLQPDSGPGRSHDPRPTSSSATAAGRTTTRRTPIQIAAHNLPDECVVYLLGSRYCETDRLSDLAWSLFGATPLGWARVQAICDYVHDHIAFDYNQARPTKGA
jgi:transglutaminase-like putative cysteine protease